MKIKRMTTVAMLCALYTVLSILTPIRLNNFKFTFEALPILIAGFLLGPIEGLLVGTLGSFIYQLLFSGYGITLTTILWIIPHSLSGLLVGFLAKRFVSKLNRTSIIIINCLSAFTVTLFNTLALYIDSHIYGYYSAALVFASIPLKIITGVILAILFSLFLPQLLDRLKTVIDK